MIIITVSMIGPYWSTDIMSPVLLTLFATSAMKYHTLWHTVCLTEGSGLICQELWNHWRFASLFLALSSNPYLWYVSSNTFELCWTRTIFDFERSFLLKLKKIVNFGAWEWDSGKVLVKTVSPTMYWHTLTSRVRLLRSLLNRLSEIQIQILPNNDFVSSARCSLRHITGPAKSTFWDFSHPTPQSKSTQLTQFMKLMQLIILKQLSQLTQLTQLAQSNSLNLCLNNLRFWSGESD